MQEYLLAFMLEPLEKGVQFVGWPLHITLIAPWFRTSKDTVTITKDIQRVTKTFKPFRVKGVQRARLGWRGSPVTIVSSFELHDLHRALLELVTGAGYHLPKTKHVGDSYQPHVTKKAMGELKPGHDISLDRIYLVRAPIASPRTRTKTIVAVVEL